jgi:hypothetical protein
MHSTSASVGSTQATHLANGLLLLLLDRGTLGVLLRCEPEPDLAACTVRRHLASNTGQISAQQQMRVGEQNCFA